jgi:hypothetical protein
MKEIKGSVAKILNSTQVVINRGSKGGVVKGMVFEVLDKNATQIKDPETGDLLGSIDRPKVEVRVSIVEEKLCIAGTFKTRRVNRGGTGSSLTSIAGMFSPPNYVDELETLKATEKEWEDLPEDKSYVKVGDPVRLVDSS